MLLFVDDMLIVGPNMSVVHGVKELFKSEIDMKDLGSEIDITITRNMS